MSHDIFISYSKNDKNVADAICHYLEENRMKCWIAPRDVRAGTNYGSEIVNSIRKCKIFILVFSGHANNSEHVSNEVNIAFESSNVIMPYRIENVVLNDTMTYYLNSKHWIDSYPDPESKFELLKNQIRNFLPDTQEPETKATQHKKEEPKKVEVEETSFFFCIGCGKKVPASDKFCIHCGTAIK